MSSYDTNLAAEYFVLSCLHRLGISAALTLGNKKGVDILVARDAGDAVTVEVKGVAGKYDWPASNIESTKSNHYVVLVCFEGKIGDLAMPNPSAWVVPSAALKPYFRAYKGRKNISRAAITKEANAYKNAWRLIDG